jgi:hypothetical protein
MPVSNTSDYLQDLEKSKEKLQKELGVVKSEYSLLKDKSLQDITALKEELHVAKVSTHRTSAVASCYHYAC